MRQYFGSCRLVVAFVLDWLRSFCLFRCNGVPPVSLPLCFMNYAIIGRSVCWQGKEPQSDSFPMLPICLCRKWVREGKSYAHLRALQVDFCFCLPRAGFPNSPFVGRFSPCTIFCRSILWTAAVRCAVVLAYYCRQKRRRQFAKYRKSSA